MSPRERQTFPSNDSFASVEALLETIDTVKHTPAVRRHVQFGSIQMREYNRIVGDHPDVRVGPPVSLGWEYTERPTLSIDEYETTRPPFKRMLRMTSITRKNMLRHVFDIPEEEIAAAEYECKKIREQRAVTVKQGKTSAVVESAMKRGARKLRKGFMRSLTASTHLMAGPMAVAMQA